MKMSEFKNHPLLLIGFLFFLVFGVGKLPVKEYLSLSKSYSDNVESIFIYSSLIFISVFIINKLSIPHSYFYAIKYKKYIFYLPVIVYIFVFTNGFADYFTINSSTFYSWKTAILGIKTLSSGLFEEILFRGLILGILLYNFYDSKRGILKSVIISSLIFGLIHIVNIWTENQTVKGSFNQVYAAFCLGVMYSAVYLKTGSIIILGVLHSISNFFASISELVEPGSIIYSLSTEKTVVEIIISNVLILIIFGLPLVIGLCILKQTNKRDIAHIIQKPSFSAEVAR
ncbi:MAG: CPBP family intramembrane metalloprotease [Candidatus Latescibacteria bacterium]|nr:CPBP family intramembrane metalloprotease [Candidatus Latescibacterota bacterium]